MSEAVETLDGWHVLHDFRRVDWDVWTAWTDRERRDALEAFQALWADWAAVDRARSGSFGAYQVVGHKADLLLLHFRPTLGELVDVKFRLDKTPMGRVLRPASSYLSIVELSKYLAQGDADPATNPYLKARLEPAVPDKQAVCFYPMSKRRQGADNWYMLDRETRARLMRSHGTIGRRYHDRVIQIISGSQGLDDWEWGVTLFADTALDFKKLVYEMRFDEASARYADFGPFYVGTRVDFGDVERLLAV
ncbi:MAG: heme-dependent peroxidase [Actinomycetia bacterium]|nr:heme-dependent peroxidase [Actinomycetes bacterium]